MIGLVCQCCLSIYCIPELHHFLFSPENFQELTNKLIELERHFNSLEFNKFGENEGVQRNRRTLHNRQGHSRYCLVLS